MQMIAVYGSGGFAREVAWLVEEMADRVACFIEDDESSWGSVIDGIAVVGLTEARNRFGDALVVAAAGKPTVRELLADQARAAGFSFATLVHPDVRRSSRVAIGEGSVVCAGGILTTGIELGEHVQVNLDCTIGHDAVLDDFATLAPGVHISGNVHVSRGAYIGTGAVVIDGSPGEPLVVGEGAVVGAGACVTRNVPAGATVVGVPARELTR